MTQETRKIPELNEMKRQPPNKIRSIAQEMLLMYTLNKIHSHFSACKCQMENRPRIFFCITQFGRDHVLLLLMVLVHIIFCVARMKYEQKCMLNMKILL